MLSMVSESPKPTVFPSMAPSRYAAAAAPVSKMVTSYPRRFRCSMNRPSSIAPAAAKKVDTRSFMLC